MPRSAAKTYTLTIPAGPDNSVTVWAYGLDGYARGTLLVDGVPAPGDLRFSTAYTYLWPNILRQAAGGLGGLALPALPLWLILFVPGLAVIDIDFAFGEAGFPARQGKIESPLMGFHWARWGVALGLSLALPPLAWLWLTAIGLRWSGSH